MDVIETQRATRTKPCGLQSLEKASSRRQSRRGLSVAAAFTPSEAFLSLVLEPLLHGLFFLLQCFNSSVS